MSGRGDRPLRVAMVIQRFRPRFSGQGQQLELLCRTLVRRGIEPTVVTSSYEQPSEEERLDGYRIVRLRSDLPGRSGHGPRLRMRGPVLAMRTLSRLRRDGPFDLVHVHALTDALYGSWLWGRWARRPVLFEMTLLGVDDAVTILDSPHWLAPLRHAAFRRCDGYAAISPALERKYQEAGLPAHKLRLLPQGIDIHDFRPADDPAQARADVGLPPTGPIVMFVGSLIPRKGIDILLEAWTGIAQAYPDAHLVLVGRGSLPASPAAERIRLLGVRDDVSRLLRAADVFVFPSRQEGFGTVMIEAMACGLPCVVTAQEGITDFIFGADGSSGTVVPQEDAQRLAAEVCRFLHEESRAREVGARARARAVERFDIEHIVDDYVDFYTELIEVRARS